MDQSSNTIWEHRWQALEEAMDYMIGRYSHLSNPTFKSMVACLSAFGASQFHFFNDGFKQGRLLPSLEYPVEFVLRATLDQVAFDLSVIESAVSQRVDGSEEMKATLARSDMLAQDALNLAIEGELMKETAVLTYFNKSANIRIIPYAPVALIGIPYTCLTVPADLLATPHEIGHYVYHHSQGLMAQLKAAVSPIPDWNYNWLEEIFADVYACLVAGPVSGLSFQDLVLDNPFERFVSDDGEHPVDVLRPYLYTRMLEALGFPVAAEGLNIRWQKWLKERGVPATFKPHNSDDPVTFEEARAVIEETAVKVLELLSPLKSIREHEPGRYWSQEPVQGADLENLYTLFEKKLQTRGALAVYQLQELGDAVGLVSTGSKPANKREKGATQTWRDWFKPTSSQSQDKLSPDIWVPIFTAGGWPVKGPEGVWP